MQAAMASAFLCRAISDPGTRKPALSAAQVMHQQQAISVAHPAEEERTMSRHPRALVISLLFVLIGAPAKGRAQSQGFQLNHYEPTAAGEWSFWVDHPWYSSTRYFAGGFTLDYGRAQDERGA